MKDELDEAIKIVGGAKRKVLISRRFGGFGFSHLAVKRLIAMKSDAITIDPYEKYFGLSGVPDFTTKKDYDGELRYTFDGEFYYQKFLDHVLFKEGNVYHIENREVRENKDIINLLEELGSEAISSRHASIEVVEIPWDVDYEIAEYDGSESIEEKHRSW